MGIIEEREMETKEPIGKGLVTIKVLTVQQPWASLLVAGIKHFETRTWPTPFRGELYIQAARVYTPSQLDEENKIVGLLAACGKMLPYPATKAPLGAIMGKVRVLECGRASTAPVGYMEKQLGDWDPEMYAWECIDAIALKTPVPCKGQLGIWSMQVEERLLQTL